MTDQSLKRGGRPYALFTVSTTRRVVRLKLRDEGVTVNEERLFWRDGEVEKTAALANIVEVRLSVAQMRAGTIGLCRLTFRNNASLSISSASDWGMPDKDRIATYAAFLRDLHACLALLPPDSVKFSGGESEGRYKLAFAAMIAGGLMFIALPIGLLLITSDSKAFFITGAGAFLMYPIFRTVQRNAPHSYDPVRISEDLLP